ncbi:MAG: glycosyltransferase, partial [Anaerolineae bacterium]|nr:glycosyltransferase [Anaerolineae bacterium]
VDTSHFYPIPIDEAKDFIGIPQNDRLILYVGRIEPLKGIDTLIKAIAMLEKNKPVLDKCAHYLAIIGGDPAAGEENLDAEMNRLQQLTRDLGVENLVLFMGKRGQETLPYYYSAAEFVVMPSHYESFGMVALEAMACGTPVIASQVGGLAFLVQDEVNGYAIPSDNPEILSERMKTLLCQDDLLNQLGEKAHRFAMDYSWEKITQQMMTCYDWYLTYPDAGSLSFQGNFHNH